MPTYKIIVQNGDEQPRADPFEADGLADARSQAVILAGELLREADGHFWDEGANWRVDVTDAEELVLYSLLIIGVAAPAVNGI